MFDNTLTLQIDDLTLRPIDKNNIDQLAKLAAEKKIWEFSPEPYYKSDIFKKKWVEKAFTQMQKKERLCFVVFYNTQIAGSTSYYEIDNENKKLNIGYTWFHPSFWSTKINPLSKLILINYAFESLKFNRVGFSVDSRNHRSCNALRKLGIKQEGVLRNHLILPNGIIRNSEIFSVISNEWQEVKIGIEKLVKSI